MLWQAADRDQVPRLPDHFGSALEQVAHLRRRHELRLQMRGHRAGAGLGIAYSDGKGGVGEGHECPAME